VDSDALLQSASLSVQIRNDGGAIDIGANYGIYALTIANAVGVDGRVFALEPVAKTTGYLKHSLDVNNFKQAEVLPFAISAAPWAVGARIRLHHIPFGIHLLLNYPGKNKSEAEIIVLPVLWQLG
jgi:hypothetical protein